MSFYNLQNKKMIFNVIVCFSAIRGRRKGKNSQILRNHGKATVLLYPFNWAFNSIIQYKYKVFRNDSSGFDYFIELIMKKI